MAPGPPGSPRPCRPPIARRLAVRVAILSSALLSLMAVAAPVAGANEGWSVGVNVESTEGLFVTWEYEVPWEQLVENEDVHETITVMWPQGGRSAELKQFEEAGISFARVAQLGGLDVDEIDGMTVEKSDGTYRATLIPGEIVGFSDGNPGDSDPVMALLMTDATSGGYAVFPWQAGREQETFAFGPGKKAVVVSIQVRGRLLKTGPVEASPAEPQEGQAVSFSLPNVELEGHPDPQAEYEWNFGDGETSDEASPVHMFGERGVYTVTVKVQDPAQDAHGAARPAVVRVSEKKKGSPPPPPPPPTCEVGGSPPCGEEKKHEEEKGPAHGAPEGTTSGSRHQKHGASTVTPASKSRASHRHDRARHPHDGEEGSGTGPGNGTGGNGGGEGDSGRGGPGGGGPGADNAGVGRPGAGAPSGSPQAHGSTASEGAGDTGRSAAKPRDGAIQHPAARPTIHHPSADQLVGVLIGSSSGGRRREGGSRGEATHRSPSSLLGLSSGAGSSAGDAATWVLVGASLLASVALGTVSEMWPRLRPWQRHRANRPGSRIRTSGVRS